MASDELSARMELIRQVAAADVRADASGRGKPESGAALAGLPAQALAALARDARLARPSLPRDSVERTVSRQSHEATISLAPRASTRNAAAPAISAQPRQVRQTWRPQSRGYCAETGSSIFKPFVRQAHKAARDCDKLREQLVDEKEAHARIENELRASHARKQPLENELNALFEKQKSALTLWVVASTPTQCRDREMDILMELERLKGEFPNLWTAFEAPGKAHVLDTGTQTWDRIEHYSDQFVSDHYDEKLEAFHLLRRSVMATIWFRLFAGQLRDTLRSAAQLWTGSLTLRLFVVCIQGGPISRVEASVVPALVHEVFEELQGIAINIETSIVRFGAIAELEAHLRNKIAPETEVWDNKPLGQLRTELTKVLPDAQIAHAMYAIPGLKQWIDKHDKLKQKQYEVVAWCLRTGRTGAFIAPHCEDDVVEFLGSLDLQPDIEAALQNELRDEISQGVWKSTEAIQREQERIASIKKIQEKSDRIVEAIRVCEAMMKGDVQVVREAAELRHRLAQEEQLRSRAEAEITLKEEEFRRERDELKEIVRRQSESFCACGAAFPPESLFCRNCGRRRSEETICACGEPLLPHMSFCRSCGRARPETNTRREELLGYLRELLLDAADLLNWYPASEDERLAKARLLADDLPQLQAQLVDAVMDAVMMDTAVELTRIDIISCTRRKNVDSTSSQGQEFDDHEGHATAPSIKIDSHAENEPPTRENFHNLVSRSTPFAHSSLSKEEMAGFVEHCASYEDELRLKYNSDIGRARNRQ